MITSAHTAPNNDCRGFRRGQMEEVDCLCSGYLRSCVTLPPCLSPRRSNVTTTRQHKYRDFCPKIKDKGNKRKVYIPPLSLCRAPAGPSWPENTTGTRPTHNKRREFKKKKREKGRSYAYYWKETQLVCSGRKGTQTNKKKKDSCSCNTKCVSIGLLSKL